MVATHARRRARPPAWVSIVSANPETLDGLQSYLDGAGVSCRCARTVTGFDRIAPPRATAAVIFPDDFEDAAVLTLVSHLRRVRPRLLAVIVTREPRRFLGIAKPDGRSIPPVVLPKPSFGWDILDALRAHADAAAS